MSNQKPKSERQWDSWNEVYHAKRHGSCKHDHSPRQSARIEADLYCLSHDLSHPTGHLT